MGSIPDSFLAVYNGDMSNQPPNDGTDSPQDRFPTTHWSWVAAAGEPEGREALGGLCSAYWSPVYGFIRRKGHSPDEALDLTQEYFARLLEKGTVAAAERSRGRFRTFLLTDCSYFLADRRDHAKALKRGGGRAVLPIDARDAEGRLIREPADGRTPERLFERDWALAMLGRVSDQLERDYASGGRAEVFRLLKPVLSLGGEVEPYAAIAAEMGTTEGNVRVTVHRLRARFGVELRRQIAATLDDPSPSDVDDELRSLLEALGP
jgi:DNA-directed RNA polymerase specialized sigma24 family protein